MKKRVLINPEAKELLEEISPKEAITIVGGKGGNTSQPDDEENENTDCSLTIWKKHF